MKRYIGLLVVVVLIAGGLLGCKEDIGVIGGADGPTAIFIEPKENDKTARKTVSVTDLEGEKVEIPAEIKSIVSLSPAVTQVLVDLGLEGKLVAVDPYSLPIIKNQQLLTFEILNPDAELLANLEADLVFATGMSKKDGDDPLKLLSDLGATVIYIPVSESVAEIKKDVLFLGEVTHKKAEAEGLITVMEEEMNLLKELSRQIQTPKRVYFEIAPEPGIYTFGTGVYLNEMLNMIGAENIFADKKGWISVSPEAIVSENPDVIITNVDWEPDSVEKIKSRAGFDQTTAVLKDQVYLVSNATSSYSNHKIAQGMGEIAKAVYPEIYGE